MFSLIITIVSIALVAALALATIYYGGDAFTEGADSANAAQLVNQGQQLLGAAEIYKSNEGVWPPSIPMMIEKGYLKAIPAYTASSQGATSTAFAQSGEGVWAMPLAGNPTFVVEDVVRTGVCQEVNRKARGDNGILTQARTTLTTQCFGALTDLVVVVTKTPGDLASVLTPALVIDTVVPTDLASPDWSLAPGADAPAAGGVPVVPGSGTPSLSFQRYAEFTGVEDAGNRKTLLLNTGNAYLLQVQDQNTYNSVIRITNTSTDTVTFNFPEGDVLYGAEWYGESGEPDPYCDGNGTLAAGASCLLDTWVVNQRYDGCSFTWRENLGVGDYSIGSFDPTCPPPPPEVEVVSLLPQTAVYEQLQTYTAVVRNIGCDSNTNFLVYDGRALDYQTCSTDANGLTTVTFTPIVLPFAIDLVFTFETEGTSGTAPTVPMACPLYYIKTAAPGGQPLCTFDPSLYGFYFGEDTENIFGQTFYTQSSYQPSETIPSGVTKAVVQSTQLDTDYRYYAAILPGVGSGDFESDLRTAYESNDLILEVEGSGGAAQTYSMSGGNSFCATANSINLYNRCRVEAVGVADSNTPGNVNVLSLYGHFHKSTGKLSGLSIQAYLYSTQFSTPSHFNNGTTLVVKRKGTGVVMFSFSIRSPDALLAPTAGGYDYTAKQLRLGTHTYALPKLTAPLY